MLFSSLSPHIHTHTFFFVTSDSAHAICATDKFLRVRVIIKKSDEPRVKSITIEFFLLFRSTHHARAAWMGCVYGIHARQCSSGETNFYIQGIVVFFFLEKVAKTDYFSPKVKCSLKFLCNFVCSPGVGSIIR